MRWLVPYLAYAYLMLVGATTRVRVHGEEHKLELRKKDRRFIYAFWHNRQIFFGGGHHPRIFRVDLVIFFQIT